MRLARSIILKKLMRKGKLAGLLFAPVGDNGNKATLWY